MIDSHCHLNFAAFEHDRQQVLAHCQALGISKIVVPGTQAKDWPELLQLCQQFPQLSCALGIHPYFIDRFKPQHLLLLTTLIAANRKNICAVGEIGLDFVKPDAKYKQTQLDVFSQQLVIANQFDLPVIIHHRRSHNEIIRILKLTPVARGGTIHGFSGSYQQAKSYIDMGFYLGVGGTITYPRAKKTRETLKRIPLQHLLVETDAPDMPLNGRQGERNSPEYLPEILTELASLKQANVDEVEQQTNQNCAQLFGL